MRNLMCDPYSLETLKNKNADCQQFELRAWETLLLIVGRRDG